MLQKITCKALRVYLLLHVVFRNRLTDCLYVPSQDEQKDLLRIEPDAQENGISESGSNFNKIHSPEISNIEYASPNNYLDKKIPISNASLSSQTLNEQFLAGEIDSDGDYNVKSLKENDLLYSEKVKDLHYTALSPTFNEPDLLGSISASQVSKNNIFSILINAKNPKLREIAKQLSEMSVESLAEFQQANFVMPPPKTATGEELEGDKKNIAVNGIVRNTDEESSAEAAQEDNVRESEDREGKTFDYDSMATYSEDKPQIGRGNLDSFTNKTMLPKVKVNGNEVPEKAKILTATGNTLNRNELRQLWIDTNAVLGDVNKCHLPGFRVVVRCAGSIAEVRVASWSHIQGKITIEGSGSTLHMNGTWMTIYIMWTQSDKGTEIKAGTFLLAKDIVESSLQRSFLSTKLILQESSKTCEAKVECHYYGQEKIVIGELEKETVNNEIRNFSLLKTSLNILQLTNKGYDYIYGLVTLGTNLRLIVKAVSRDYDLDLHIPQCIARGEKDGTQVTLVKDGCSRSPVFQNFVEEISLVEPYITDDHFVKKVIQQADLIAFNTRNTLQNITISCSIKICEKLCPDSPECVQSKMMHQRNVKKKPLFIRHVLLSSTYTASGVRLHSLSPGKTGKIDKHLSRDFTSEEFTNSSSADQVGHTTSAFYNDCIPWQIFCIVLMIVTCIYTVILGICVHYARQVTVKRIHKNYMEEVESPPRALYSEYSSPRRRSPNSQDSFLSLGEK